MSNFISVFGNVFNREDIHFLRKMYRYDSKFIILLQLKYKDNTYCEKEIYMYDRDTGYGVWGDTDTEKGVEKRNIRIETKMKNEYDRLCRHLITNNENDDKMFFHTINLKK